MSREIPKDLLPDLFRAGGAPPSLRPGHLLTPNHPRTRSAVVAAAIVDVKVAAIMAASEAICRAFPYATKLGPDAESKCQRDLMIVVDYIALGIAYESPEFLKERMLHWFRMVLSHLDFPGHADSIRGCYSILRQELMTRLDEADRAIAQPYFDLVVEAFSREGGTP